MYYTTVQWSPLKYTIHKRITMKCVVQKHHYTCTCIIHKQLSQVDNDGEECLAVALLPPAAR